MYKYRISKYDPQFRNDHGVYQKIEWTSYWDIGNIYDGKVLKKEDYLKVEEQYSNTVLKVLENSGTIAVVIEDLELNYTINKMKEMFSLRGLDLSTEDELIINSLRNNLMIKVSALSSYIKLILRECFWCKLTDTVLLNQVEFGYDFYVYISCNNVPKTIVNNCRDEGIFIEKMRE